MGKMKRKKKLDSENDFTCPTCGSDSMDYLGLSPTGSPTFKCRKCKKVFFKSNPITVNRSYEYVSTVAISRLTCPHCNSRNIVDAGYGGRFWCKKCGRIFS